MMTALAKNRIESLDLLKGIAMVLMALDHTRDYFNHSAFLFDPIDPHFTNWPILITRLLTHFCAPAFCLLAGISAYLVGRKKSRNDLALFLLKRGLWLIFIQVTIVTFAWNFNITFNFIFLSVIWSLGVSMIALAAIIYLPKTAILILSVLLIFGHNLLDLVQIHGNIWWAILHQYERFTLPGGRIVALSYPLIPWIGVMSLGFWFGSFYDKAVEPAFRRKIFNIIGLSAIALFIVLRWSNWYGDLHHWVQYDTVSKTIMSFLGATKYPPSLLFLLMTLGPSLLFLANSENLKGKVVKFFSTFGRVPFFYYILHIYLIHFIAGIAAKLTGFGWGMMSLPDFVIKVPALKEYGFDLWVVYLVWIAVILMLYPVCRKFDIYKLNHKEKWWLSYL